MSTLRQIGWTYPVKGGIALASSMPPLAPADIDRSKCAVTATITTPAKDRQGEIIEPLGGIYADYARNPVVFFDHRSNQNYPNAIAMAWEFKDGPLEVYFDATRVIAKHYFYQNDPMSMQCFRLIDDGLLLGISLGFNAVPEYAEVIGVRPDGKGKAYRYHKWTDLEHTHTPLGVNAEALTIAVQKGRVGGEPMLPMIVKSFQEHALPTPIQANGWTPPEKKAMADDTSKFDKEEEEAGAKESTPEKKPSPTPHEDPKGGDKAEKPMKPMKPSARMLMDTAQGIHDFNRHCDKMMETAEHPESIDAMHHVKELMAQATDHVEGALATHHPEVKYEAPPEEQHDKPENDDENQPKGGLEDKEGEYKVKSHRWSAPRFGPLNEKALSIVNYDEPLTPEDLTRLKELEKRAKANEYQINAAKRRLEQRA